jgi:hypothetical protein
LVTCLQAALGIGQALALLEQLLLVAGQLGAIEIRVIAAIARSSAVPASVKFASMALGMRNDAPAARWP